MKKFLVTGFQPFGGETVNPSVEAVKLLPDEIMGVEIVKIELPVVYYEALRVLEKAIDDLQPVGILSAGQADSRPNMTVERTAVNVAEANIPDNNGTTLTNQRVYENAPDGYFSTLPIKAMIAAINDAGIPASISNTAGTFVCNDVLYSLLHHFACTGTRCGFIHVPWLPEQGEPNLSLENTAKALEIAISAL